MSWIDASVVFRLGWTLIHFVWQGVVLAGVLALMLWATKGRSPRLRYGLACLVLATIAITPVATWYRLGQPHTAIRALVGPADKAVPDPRSATPSNKPSPTVEADPSSNSWEWLLPLCVGFWLLGVAILSLRLASGWAWLQWLRRRPDTTPASDDIQLRLLRLCQRMNLASNIRILLCEKVHGPTVMGWLRPVILLPSAALLGMPVDQMELVLAHELAHILRHDFAINLLQSCVEVLLFYHPAVWWVSAKIRQERELCCDDLAVRTTGDALDYAAALTRLEALCRPPESPRHAAHALAMGATGGSFMNRISRLISPIAPTPLAPRAGLVLLFVLGCVFTLQARSRIQDPPASNDPAPIGTIQLRRYDKDTTDGKYKAGTIDLRCQFVAASELDRALTSLESLPKDPARGYVDLEAKVGEALPGHRFTYKFRGCDPVRVRRVIQAWPTFPFLSESGDLKKPGQVIIQRNCRFTYELGLIPQGMQVQVWAGDVPAEMVIQALTDLMAMAPEAGIPQEVRHQITPGSGNGSRVSLNLRDKDPMQLMDELEAVVKKSPN